MGRLYIYLHAWWICIVNVGKYTVPMDPQGMCTQIFSNMFCWFIPYLGNDPIELGKYTIDAMGQKDPLMSNYNDFSLLSPF